MIVTPQTLVFLAAFFFAPKHGLLASRRRVAHFANRRPLMDTLYQLLSEPFAYPFMQRAIVAAIVTGVVCAVLSCYLALKGWSLMGDAISHAVLPGIVVAFVVGIPLAIGAFLSGILRGSHRLPGEQPV